jgi:hypothetical protein
MYNVFLAGIAAYSFLEREVRSFVKFSFQSLPCIIALKLVEYCKSVQSC